MNLPKNLISQFVKNTTDSRKTVNKESFTQGTMVEKDGQYYVKLFGVSDENTDNGSCLIPASAIPANIVMNQPVTVMIKNHTATVIGNIADAATVGESGGVMNNTAVLNMESISDADIESLWDGYF